MDEDGEFLIVRIGEINAAISTQYIESIHPITSMRIIDESNRCLIESTNNNGKNIPIIDLGLSSSLINRDLDDSSKRVLFLLDTNKNEILALIANKLLKLANIPNEIIKNLIFDDRHYSEPIHFNGEEVIVMELRNVFRILD